MGTNALSREEAWFCIAAEYSIHVNKAFAGLSQVIGALLHSFFCKNGSNFHITGISLDIEDGARIWAVLGGVLQDGGAHKST